MKTRKRKIKTKEYKFNQYPELKTWREKLKIISPRISHKLQIIDKTQAKLMKTHRALDKKLNTTRRNKMKKRKNNKSRPGTAPTNMNMKNKSTKKTIDSNSIENNANENMLQIKTEEEDDNETTNDDTICNKNLTEQDLKYEIAYDIDEELAFEIDIANEGVYVSELQESAIEKGIELYSTIFSINHQNVTNVELEKMKKLLAKLPKPCKIFFRRSMVQTPNGIGSVIHRIKSEQKVVIKFDFSTESVEEDCIKKYIPCKYWTESEEEQLLEFIHEYQAQIQKKSKFHRGSRNKSAHKKKSNPKLRAIPWEAVTETLHRRTPRDCEKRWELINTLNHVLNEDILNSKLAIYTRKGDYQSVKRIIERCPQLLQQADKNRSTPLFTACWYGKYDIIKLMIEHGSRVNHSNLKGNFAIQMAIENGFTDIVELLIANDAKINLQDIYNLIDRCNINIKPEIILAVSRAQLQAGDKIWFEHQKLGLIQATIIDRLSDLRPVHLVIKMRSLQFQNALFTNDPTTKILRISILDPRLKPRAENKGPALKELRDKKDKMLQRFIKWDMFWKEKNMDIKNKLHQQSIVQKKEKLSKQKIKIESSHTVQNNSQYLPSLPTMSTLEEGNEEEDIKNEISEETDFDNKRHSETTNATKETTKPIHKHTNYYLQTLRKLNVAQRCIGLRKLQNEILSHPDLKDDRFDEQQKIHQQQENQNLCYLAKEHIRRFDIVMENIIKRN